MSNVHQLVPRWAAKEVVQEETIMPTIPGVHGLIFSVTDWAEANNVDVYSPDFIYFCADFMQRLQIMAHKAAA